VKPFVITAAIALALGFALGHYAAKQPLRALDAEAMGTALDEVLTNREDSLARASRLAGLLERLTPGNVEAAAAAYEAHVFTTPEHEIHLFMKTWVRFDAPAAFAHALSWPEAAGKRNTAVGAVVSAWARRAPMTVQREVEPLLEDADRPLREALVAALANGWIQSGDVAGATRYLAESMPAGVPRERATARLVGVLARSGPESVMRWADALPDGSPRDDFKSVAFRKAARSIASEDPPYAARWIASHAGNSYAEGALRVVALAWAESFPAAALEWLQQQPHSRSREGTVARVFRDWWKLDPQGARHWLESAPAATPLDPALEVLAEVLARDEPEAAVACAARISDEERRERNLVAAAQAWFRSDPDAARAWLAESGLSEQAQREVTSGRVRPARHQNLRALEPGSAADAEAADEF
jgi:hypothetical protein